VTSSEISSNPWTYDCKTTAAPDGTNITAPGWHTVDIAFTSAGFSVYYDGALYMSVPEAITPAGNDPMWVTVSDGSCNGSGGNECPGGAPGGPAGTTQVAYISEFS